MILSSLSPIIAIARHATILSIYLRNNYILFRVVPLLITQILRLLGSLQKWGKNININKAFPHLLYK